MCLCFAPPPPTLLFFSPRKAAVSPVITGCVSEVSGLLCVSLWKATRAPPACLLSLGLCCRREALARVIALWGIALALFVCLFTCLL